MNPLLLRAEVQEFLRSREKQDPGALALQKSPFPGISPAELATQLDSRQRSKYKLSSWYHSEGIYYPKRLSIEQSSSESTAFHKASLLPPGLRILDLTGGFGVDSFAFAKTAHSVVYCERDKELAAIVEHNAAVMGVQGMECIAGDGLVYLQECPGDQFDLIYVDPARRQGSRKVFRLEDCEPNMLELLPLLFKKSPEVMVKLAPMMDIREAIRNLSGLYEVQVVSVGGECKELLCRISRPKEKEKLNPVILTATAISSSNKAAKKLLSFSLQEEQQAEVQFGPPQQYLYEPDAALLKAGAFRFSADHYGLHKLHLNTHLYTGDTMIEDFMGKITLIISVMPYADFKKLKPTPSGNVIVRNFPLKADEIRKKHRISESKDHNLYFCTDMEEKLVVIQTIPTP
ncbi:MAG TPA: RsmD family RNA methyltransferase [Sphingobacteriaceae bacterium]|nr:RsmD family RNA methyltransferase [Sphingobacteriaceae bacterium]